MATASPNTPEELHHLLGEFLGRLGCMADAESMDALVDLDLSFSQARTLFVVAQHAEPVSIHEVALALRMSVAAAGRNIDHLVTSGLLVRREDEHDRRVKRVSLSESGRALAQRHVEARHQTLRRFADRLAPDDRERLCAALRSVLTGSTLQSRREEVR